MIFKNISWIKKEVFNIFFEAIIINSILSGFIFSLLDEIKF